MLQDKAIRTIAYVTPKFNQKNLIAHVANEAKKKTPSHYSPTHTGLMCGESQSLTYLPDLLWSTGQSRGRG